MLFSPWVLGWGKKPNPEILTVLKEKKNNHHIHLFCNAIRTLYEVSANFNETHRLQNQLY